MPTRLALALAAALLAAPPLAAQGPSQPTPARALKLRCLSFRINQPLPPLFAHPAAAPADATGTPVAVKSYLNHESETIAFTGDQLVFTTAAGRASLTDPAALVATLKVPAGLRTAILIFLAGDGQPGSPRCRVLPIDDSPRAFPPGSIRMVNLCHQPLRILLETTAFEFRSGESKLIEDPPVGPANASAMTAFTRAGDQWQGVNSASWPHPGRKRVIKVAFDNPASRQIEIRGIRDITGTSTAQD